MPFRLSTLEIVSSRKELHSIPRGKVLINTINAHSYNVAQKDHLFAEALTHGDYLIPDGASIVLACKWLKKALSHPKERIAGWDLFIMEMERLNETGGKCVFMGSSEKVLDLISAQVKKDYPNIIVSTFSPPYKKTFSPEDSKKMVDFINEQKPDLLWIGLTAPKQEKWTYQHWEELDIQCHVGTIGAVFDFYAGTIKRAPLWWQNHSLEWLYRLIQEPRRMWKRYIIGNTLFVFNMIRNELFT